MCQLDKDTHIYAKLDANQLMIMIIINELKPNRKQYNC